jgi:hypothetical protein
MRVLREAETMTDKARKVYEIAERHELAALLENLVDDLEEFAEGINADSEQKVLEALYKKCC